MAVTLEDVARRAGVSTASVSRVLTEKPHVSAEVRQRVLAAVDALGFSPSRVARSLRAQYSQVWGLIISDIQNPFFTAMVRAIEDVAYRHRYNLVLCNADENPEKEALYMELMVAEKVAGVIVSPTPEGGSSCRRLLAAGIPFVAIDRRVHNVEASIDTVLVNNEEATIELVSQLIQNQHKRIGAVIGSPSNTTGLERHRGFVHSLQQHQIPIVSEYIHQVPSTRESGYRYTCALLDLPEPPSALFLGNNLLTMGALQAIHERRLCIPEDVALVAFDEMEWMFLMNPGLTVAAQPVYEMGKSAADLLLHRIQDRTCPAQEVRLQATVRVRESSGPRLQEHHQG